MTAAGGRGELSPAGPAGNLTMKRLFLIDGSYCFHRAFYAIRGLATSKGFPTNAIFGFTNMLMKVLRSERPDYLVVAFDPPGPTFRDEMYSEYKATREPPDPALIRQIPYLKKIPEALRIASVEVPKFEADDVIGTLARRGLREGMDVVIVTADKDMMQLVTKEAKDRKAGIVLFDDMKNRTIGISEVREKFGVGPDRVIDVLALMGDASDNIPGVRGIGEKGASKIVAEYGSLDQILAGMERVEPRYRAKLEADRENAQLSRRLATIRCDLPIQTRWEPFVPGKPDAEKAGALFRELEFHAFLKSLEAEGAGEGGGSRSEISAAGYRALQTLPDLERFLGEARKQETLSVDLETDSTDPMRANIVGISLAFRPGEAVYIPVGHRYLGVPRQIPLDEVLKRLRPLLEAEKPAKVGQNIKYDSLILRRNGIHVHPIACDTMVAAYLVNADKGPFGLERLAREYLQHEMMLYEDVAGKGKNQVTFDQVPVERATEYSCADADVVLRLVPLLQKRIREDGLQSLWDEVECPLLDVLLEMERVGVRIDRGILKRLSSEFLERMRVLLGEIHKLAGREFNVDSPKQLQEILFRELGLKTGRKTKTGFSTDVGVLEKLAEEHPLPARILDYRTLSKLRSTYVEALPSLIHPETERIHTSYNQAVAATGRLSSSDPNLQNIPIRTEEGRKIRGAFVPAAGHRFVSADYSQIELRVMAHLSKDEALVRAFREDQDIHRATAAEVFGVAPEAVDSGQRRAAKEINFGIIYGISAFGLSQRLGMPSRQAQLLIDRYFERYAGVKRFIERHLKKAAEIGHVTTILGRRRYVPDLKSGNRVIRGQAERIAVNAPIQGSAADIMKVAMIRLDRRLRKEKSQAAMILQVHDELVLETPKNEVPAVRRALREEMESACALAVPLKVDVGEGESWADLK